MSEPWVDVIKDNCLPDRGLSIGSIAPTLIDGIVEQEIDAAAVKTELTSWETTLIMFTLGEDLSMNLVRQFMIKVWNFVSLPELYYNDQGYFPIRLKSPDDRDMVMTQGPYSIYGIPQLPFHSLQKSR